MSSAAEHSLLRRLHQRYGGSLVTVGTRLIDIPCRYGMHLMIALRLSLDQVGAFYIVFGALMIASGLGRLGIDRALTREMARLLAADDAAGARAAMRRAAIMVLLLSLALTALALLAAWPLAAYVMRKPDMAPLFVIGALAILPQNFANLVAGALAGLHRVTQSQIVYTWLWPGLFCVLVFALPMSDAHALAAVAASMTLATLIGGVMLLRDLPAVMPGRPSNPPEPLLGTGLSLFSLELVQLLISAAPPFILGIMASTDEVGLYAIAWRVVLVIYMFVSGVASMVAPRFARLYMIGDLAGLRQEAARALALALTLAIPPILAVIVFPDRILALFGQQFLPAVTALHVLIIGQLAAALTTTTPELLGMTGYARALLRVNGLATLVLIGGLVLLSAPLGAQGAAIATSATMLVNAIGCSLIARDTLGFTPLGAVYAMWQNRRAALPQ